MTDIDLSGTWQFRPGPDDEGPYTHEIEVPSAWQTTLGPDFHGVGWYRKTIDLPPHPGRTWIRFDAVATEARVHINDTLVGTHTGDWVPFALDITDAIRGSTTVTIEVRVDEAPGHITQGYHDAQSLHHGGIWQGVRLSRTGEIAALPDGIALRGDPDTGEIRLTADLALAPRGCSMSLQIIDPDGTIVSDNLHVDDPRPWSPASPALYRAKITLADPKGLTDDHEVPFGFRTFRTGGPGNTRILLNDSPITIRGMLDWGHEPRFIAPAPDPGTIRDRFRHLKALGFNTVALCMYYPPQVFHDIADEMGMIIWQVHPVWKAPMADHYLPQYRSHYETFIRRDRRHPSVAIVSATCEHEDFPEALADWWWTHARQQLPDTLLQVQTGFLSWSDSQRTDLHDEHVYDSSGRWVDYLEDLQEALEDLPPRPFVMGETILFTSWPDTEALKDIDAWWAPVGLDACIQIENDIARRHGPDTLQRFRTQAERFALVNRRFQVERFRSYPNHAGFVLNHIRDVPRVRCGFMDDLDRWRLSPEDCLPWLGDDPDIRETPGHFRGFIRGDVDRPTRLRDLWALPEPTFPRVFRQDNAPPDPEPTFEEKGYSSGWALPVKTWRNEIPRVPYIPIGDPPEHGTLITHRITPEIIDRLTSGTRTVLLAPPARFINLYGVVPFVSEEGPFGPGDSDWIIDLLGYDLTRRSIRGIPTEEQGIIDHIDPLIRLIWTHDAGDRPTIYDQVFTTRIGRGHLVVSCLDTSTDAGRHLLMLLCTNDIEGPARMTPEMVMSWIQGETS